jgi:hypothetical protein
VRGENEEGAEENEQHMGGQKRDKMGAAPDSIRLNNTNNIIIVDPFLVHTYISHSCKVVQI